MNRLKATISTYDVFENFKFEIIKDRNGEPVYQDSRVKIILDKSTGTIEYECDIICEAGGFYAVNAEKEFQISLWEIDQLNIEVIK